MSEADLARLAAVNAERTDAAARRGRSVIEWPLGNVGAGSRESFGLLLANKFAFVHDGYLVMHGVAGSPFAVTGYWTGSAGISLAGSVEWIVLRHAKDHTATDLIAYAGETPPATSGNYWYVPLYRLQASADGKTYRMTWDRRHDVQLGAPL
jgi:hypothetical protein